MPVLIALIVIVMVLLLVSFFMMNFVTRPKRPSLEESEKIEKSKDVWGGFDNYPKEEMNVTCRDGYVLHGVLLKNDSKKYVIVTHGWIYNRNGSIKYANIFYDLGYNVYIYDLRYFGENKATYCSMGPNESRDIIDIQKALLKKFGSDITIGLHGESLGCASSLMALGLSQDFSFCIADCGYADLKVLLLDLVKQWFHMPHFMAYIANFWMKLIHGTSFFEVRPMNALKENQVPVLFVHGGADDFINPKHGRMNFEACAGPKRMEIFETAKHADAYFNDPERYRRMVAEFLRGIN